MSLEKDIYKQEGILRISPILCTLDKITYIQQPKREASFCVYRKASMTVEAAVVIPLTMGFLLTILFFFRVLFVQTCVEEALVYTGRAIAVESCLTDTEEALFLSAEGILNYKLSQENDIKRYVIGGALGVSLLGSQMSGKEILLIANYMVKIPIEFFGQKGIWLTSENSFVKWKGDLYTGTSEGEWVYITETGSVYHKNTSCRSLDLSIQEGLLKEISLYRGVNGQKYYPCDRCLKNLHEIQVVYFTDYGNLYHGEISCSALKRTITKVLLSQVGNRRECSFCY